MILANGSFIDGLIQTSDSTATSLALGNCDPLTITLVGHGGYGNFYTSAVQEPGYFVLPG